MAGGARSYLAAFAELHAIASADERRQVARQALAMLAEIAQREPAPLEGIATDHLLLSVRAALTDGLLADLDSWLAPASAAIALFELAQALPAGAERRELGRRVLTRLRNADRDTFVRLLIALARTSPKIVASEGLRARLEVVLAAPLTAPGMIGELAIGLLAQPSLAHSWVEEPATGSLPGRRLAARLLAHGAREAIKRHDAGDRGGVRVLARPSTRAALARLLGDREALVWRFGSVARGVLAHVDSALADDIDRELRPSANNTVLRRASASAAAALERGGAARRWVPVLVERASREPGIARGTILGLAGLAISAAGEADVLATQLVARSPLEAAEALADLRRDEAAPLLPDATAAALRWVREQLDHEPDVGSSPAASDDGRWALLRALDAELSGSTRSEGVGVPIAAARVALDAGDVAAALRHARVAVDEISAAADWLRDATDDDPLDRRHSMRLLRELDRELLADNALYAVLALAGDTDPARAQFAAALATIEAALLAREQAAEAGAVAHGGLRVARLRALIRLLDGVRITSDADLAPRLAAMRQLMERAQRDHSSLRRAVWAAMTRAGDALLRDGYVELTDLLLAWTTTFTDEDFAIVREASMVPEIEAVFEAHARLEKATWEASDPDDGDAVCAVVERLAELADALPPEQSPRVESVRLALARLGNLLLRIALAGSQRSVAPGTFDAIATELGTLARRVYGARQRLGLDATEASGELESAIRNVETAIAGRDGGAPSPYALDEAIAGTIDLVRGGLPPAIAATIERVFGRLARRPLERSGPITSAPLDVVLPQWVPLSRLVGGFYVERSIGRGAGGSVLLAVRADQRGRPERELVALKVPDYSGDAARAMAETEFQQMFREEAGALLALPRHPNIARFITFDASAHPKPILVMEYVRGTNLERTLESADLDMLRALKVVDDLFAGLEAMHAIQIAHLDVKPPNLVLRDGSGEAVLVDFGLAGQRLRPGCGSAHYGALEVWSPPVGTLEPFATDVYAAAAVTYEVLTGELLFQGDSLPQLVAHHQAAQPGRAALDAIARRREIAPLADVLRAALARDARKRPTVARLRAGFRSLERDLRKLQWPLRA